MRLRLDLEKQLEAQRALRIEKEVWLCAVFGVVMRCVGVAVRCVGVVMRCVGVVMRCVCGAIRYVGGAVKEVRSLDMKFEVQVCVCVHVCV